MQEQLRQAMQGALGAGLGADAGAFPASGRKLASGTLRAMLLAKESGCDCEPCKLLRPELNEVMTVVLRGLTDALNEPPEPVTTAPAAAPVEVATVAAGTDTPA
jgi:hypothetical protein